MIYLNTETKELTKKKYTAPQLKLSLYKNGIEYHSQTTKPITHLTRPRTSKKTQSITELR